MQFLTMRVSTLGLKVPIKEYSLTDTGLTVSY
jgi:hypothetical protein